MGLLHTHPAIDARLQSLNHPSLPGIDLSLERMRALLVALGHPERRLPPVIHLAGTNGKGSTQAFLRAIYQAAGYRVHAYTSPHLVAFNERIVLSGGQIGDEYLLALLDRVAQAAQAIPVTFFEATTAAAFLAFAEHSADVLLLETGLGGRLDATNVVEAPLATILTPIDYDHTEFLGATLAAIATEKAGILKRGVPCVVGAQAPEAREVIKRAVRAVDVPLILHGRDWSYEPGREGFTLFCGADRYALPAPSLLGVHQYHNAGLAAVAAVSLSQLPVPEAALARGIAHAHWPARLQHLTRGPLVEAWGARGLAYLDGGHNAHAAAMLAQWASTQSQPVTLVLGMMERKDARAFLAPLVPHLREVIAVPVVGEGACHAPEHLAAQAKALGVAQARAVAALGDVAWHGATASPGPLLIAGSLFLAGEVLKNHS